MVVGNIVQFRHLPIEQFNHAMSWASKTKANSSIQNIYNSTKLIFQWLMITHKSFTEILCM